MKRLLIIVVMCVVLLAFSAGCTDTSGDMGSGLGVPVHVDEDGTTVYQNADGSFYAVDTEGNEVLYHADGSYSGRSADGDTVTRDADGNVNYQGTDGSGMVGNQQEGSAVDEYGATVTWTTDANGVTHYTVYDPTTGETETYSMVGGMPAF